MTFLFSSHNLNAVPKTANSLFHRPTAQTLRLPMLDMSVSASPLIALAPIHEARMRRLRRVSASFRPRVPDVS